MGALTATALAQSQGQAPPGSLSNFQATSLTGQAKTDEDLTGSPTVLIVTPTRAAGNASSSWGTQLEGKIPAGTQLRGVIAVELPFFISEQMALDQARSQLPRRSWDQTWLVTGEKLEQSLGVPSEAGEPYVLVLDAQGQVVAKENGTATQQKVSRVLNAIPQTARTGQAGQMQTPPAE